MSDKTVEALRQIEAFAENQGAVVSRVEVALRDNGDAVSVEFTAYLSPKPLEQETACVGYEIVAE